MTPKEFVEGFYLERKSFIDQFFSGQNDYDVSELIASLNLDTEGTERLRQILNGALRDAFYTILMGLSGEAQIGRRQETYLIKDESGNELSGSEIEVFAFEYFHDNKFEIDKNEADFIAILTYRTTEQGGRKMPVASGYRPQIKFGFDVRQTSGQQTFIGRELVFPGDTVEAEIKLLSTKFLKNNLSEGMEFEFREGLIVIGIGKIKHIINEELRSK